jgi:hypothetical protein
MQSRAEHGKVHGTRWAGPINRAPIRTASCAGKGRECVCVCVCVAGGGVTDHSVSCDGGLRVDLGLDELLGFPEKLRRQHGHTCGAITHLVVLHLRDLCWASGAVVRMCMYVV